MALKVLALCSLLSSIHAACHYCNLSLSLVNLVTAQAHLALQRIPWRGGQDQDVVPGLQDS